MRPETQRWAVTSPSRGSLLLSFNFVNIGPVRHCPIIFLVHDVSLPSAACIIIFSIGVSWFLSSSLSVLVPQGRYRRCAHACVSLFFTCKGRVMHSLVHEPR